MIKKIIELLNQLFVTYTIWFQNGTNISSMHLVSEWFLFSCLMPSEQRFSYIMVKTSYNLMRWCLLLVDQHDF
jgi:hypothetical protein